MQQLHLALGKIVLRPDDRDRLNVRWNFRDLEQIQFLELDVLVFNHRFHQRKRTARARFGRHRRRQTRRRVRDRRLLVAEHIADDVLLSFHEIDHRARDRLLALERRDLRRLAEHRIALVDLRHLGCFHRLVAVVVIENDLALDIDHSFRGILILGQERLHVLADGIVRGEENRHPHFAFDRFQEALRLVRERVFLVAREVPPPVMLEAEIIRRDSEEEQERELHDHVHPDPEAMNFLGLFRLCFFVSHRHSLHLRD